MYLIFGLYGLGFGDMFDVVWVYFLKEEEEEYLDDIVKFSLIGWLNVGKFFILNVLFGEDCVIVFDIVGIICDVIDIIYIFDG